MVTPLFLIALPFVSFVILFFGGTALPRFAQSVMAVGGIALSAVGALILLLHAEPHLSFEQNLFTWIPAMLSFEEVEFAFHLDTLSLTMCLVVTFVSSWIALYAWEYMGKEEGQCRFFAAVNLFVAFMLLLVLADNLLLLFVGWEGVGLCSYILIGFYFKEPKAQAAAMKAFITTRIGDVFLLLGIIICFLLFGTLNIAAILGQASLIYPEGSLLITIAAFCFLGGAVGKSAQLPLQTWLADAMWGPTPVSALIHAATMVTAGVYLIARLGALFALAPLAQSAVLIVGAATLLFAGIIATLQTDMKKVLAYSTMSQLGYMFLALGAGAYQAAIFHLCTHAFFKALLFLSAGVIGHGLHTYDLRKMGGLRKDQPLLFWLFMVGSLNLIGLPLLSAGFFSKEWIMSQVHHVPWAWNIGVAGAAITGLYTGRMLLLAFFGERRSKMVGHAGWAMMLPLVVLAIFSLGLGWLETPHLIAELNFMSHWLASSVLNLGFTQEENPVLLFAPSLAALSGVLVAMIIYGLWRRQPSNSSFISLLRNGGAFDALYDGLILKPYQWIAEVLRHDIVSSLEAGFSALLTLVFNFIHQLHNGKLRAYISFLVMAALVMAGTMVII